MSPITTHILDTAVGKPAAGVYVTLERIEGEVSVAIGTGTTDDDGRIKTLLEENALTAGTYQLTFFVGEYLAAAGRETFYPRVPVIFEVKNPDEHYHVPLLLNPFGYSTYRGS